MVSSSRGLRPVLLGLRFVKMHGCGNDYVYVDLFEEKVRNAPALARAVSDRHAGIGSDGLILIAPSRKADVRMIMYNADGSEGAMCGNGVRCVGKLVYERGRVRRRTLTVETKSGVVPLTLHVRAGRVSAVTVDMGPPRGEITIRRLRAGDRTFEARVVSMGNPHCVVFVSGVEKFPVERYGPLLERHRAFPKRTNVEFVEIGARDGIRQRTWERGSGETMACGSGACAVASVLWREKKAPSPCSIQLRGGTLALEKGPAGNVLMTGPAVEVFSGVWPTGAERRR